MPTRSISTLSILLILVSLLAVGAAIWIFYTAPSVVTATSILGAVSVSLGNLKQFLERRRDAEPDRRNHQIGFTPRVATKPVRVAPSFKSGLYGGLIGGGLFVVCAFACVGYLSVAKFGPAYPRPRPALIPGTFSRSSCASSEVRPTAVVSAAARFTSPPRAYL